MATWTNNSRGTAVGSSLAPLVLRRFGCWRACCPRVRPLAEALFLVFSLLLAGDAISKELLAGTAMDGDGGTLEFRLDGESREEAVGGRILFGDSEYTISRMSRLGLIGAHRFGGGEDAGGERFGEFLVFSSSFSEQSATGPPWVAAQAALGCEAPYNSFAALYRVEGEKALTALGPVPYGILTEDLSKSQQSRVTCFTARPLE